MAEYDNGAPAEEDEDYVELDLEKTLTWTGNAVSIQAGGEFRLPLFVPHPSVLAIQFEVEGGLDIEFSLTFKDDNEDASSTLVEPVRVADREGQLDIDTTGVCEIVWSNMHAWMSQKVLSYQMQLAPKVNIQMRKFRGAVISAADDYRVLAAAEAADEVDRNMRTLQQRTADLQAELSGSKEKEGAAAARHERYLGHVKKLEEEVAAAKAHAEQAAADLARSKSEKASMEAKLAAMSAIRSLDDSIDAKATSTLAVVDESLELLFEAYAGAMYPQEDGEGGDDEGGASSALRIDRAELIHLLQDFEIMSRGAPSEGMCGVFVGFAQSLSPSEFKRSVARASQVLAPEKAPEKAGQTSNDKLLWLLAQIPQRIATTKLPVLDVQRRVRVLAAAEHLASALDM